MASTVANRPYRIATREKIMEAARNLELRGVKITLDKVRNEVGGGCYSTIGRVLKEYKTASESKLPQRAQRIQQIASNNLWELALSSAREEVSQVETAVKRKLSKVEKDLQRSRAAAGQVARNAGETADEHRRQIAILQGEKQVATDRADAFEMKASRTSRAEALAASETGRANAEAKRADDAEKLIEAFTRDLKTTSVELSRANQRAVEVDLELKDLATENERLKSQIAEKRSGTPLAGAFRSLITRGRRAA